MFAYFLGAISGNKQNLNDTTEHNFQISLNFRFSNNNIEISKWHQASSSSALNCLLH